MKARRPDSAKSSQILGFAQRKARKLTFLQQHTVGLHFRRSVFCRVGQRQAVAACRSEAEIPLLGAVGKFMREVECLSNGDA